MWEYIDACSKHMQDFTTVDVLYDVKLLSLIAEVCSDLKWNYVLFGTKVKVYYYRCSVFGESRALSSGCLVAKSQVNLWHYCKISCWNVCIIACFLRFCWVSKLTLWEHILYVNGDFFYVCCRTLSTVLHCALLVAKAVLSLKKKYIYLLNDCSTRPKWFKVWESLAQQDFWLFKYLLSWTDIVWNFWMQPLYSLRAIQVHLNQMLIVCCRYLTDWSDRKSVV